MGGSPPFTPLQGEGGFENTIFATYFHYLDRLLTIQMLIKPLLIVNQQSLLLAIIAQAVVCGH